MKNCIALLGLSLICGLPQAAQGQTVTPPIVPPGLEVDAPNQAFLLGHAFGTQNYEASPQILLGASPGRSLLRRPRCSTIRTSSSSRTSTVPILMRPGSYAPRGRTQRIRA